MGAVEGCKCHHEEGGGIFSSVNQMKGPFVITVTAQALDESQPSGDALDNCSHSVGVAVTNLIICKKKQFQGQRVSKFKNSRGLPLCQRNTI